MFRIFFFLLILQFSIQSLCAKPGNKSRPIHYTYTVEDGLNSNFITDLLNDSKGLLWVGTQNGMNYFDGREFHSVDFSLVNESFVAKIYEDKYGVIWFATLGGAIYKIKERKAFPFRMNKEIEESISQLIVPLDLFIVEDTILLSTSVALYKVFNDSIEIVEPFDGNFTIHSGNLWGGMRFEKQKFTTSKVHFKGKTYTLLNERLVSTSSYYYNNNKNSFAISYGSMLYTLIGDSVVKNNFKAQISNSIYYTSDSTLWLGTLKKGIFKLVNGKIKEQYFKSNSVHAIIEDFEKGLWVGTEHNGLIYIPHIDIKEKEFYTKGFLQIHNHENSFSGITTDYRIYSKGKLGKKFLDDHEVKTIHSDFSSFNSKSYIGIKLHKGSASLWGEVNWNKKTIDNILPISYTARRFLIRGNDTLIVSYGNVMNYKQAYTKNVSLFGRKLYRVSDIKALGADQYLFSHFEGISTLQFLTDTVIELKSTPSQRGINHHFQLGQRQLFALKDDFIYELNESSNTLKKLPFFSRTDIRCTKKIDDNTILLGTATGLKLLKANGPMGSDQPSMIDITHSIGLSKVQIDDIELINDTIFTLTNFRITTIPLHVIEQVHFPKGKIVLNSIKVNGQITDTSQHLVLYNDKTIVFDISSISYRDREKYRVETRLLPVKERWTKQYSENIDFYSLPANEYTFQIRDPYGQLVEYQFTVVDYFYQTWWFILLLSMVLVIILSIPFYLRYRFQVAKSKLESEKNNWRLKTLTSQLKPHFIFNALSSIQAFILKNETRTSNEFLSKFSLHIRNALEQTNADEISLNKALGAAFTYLELEQMRLSNSFQFKINTNKVETDQFFIPVMLLQPYVENAVIHGVSAIDYDGIITIDVEQKAPRKIHIRICDNGKGLEQSQFKGHGMR